MNAPCGYQQFAEWQSEIKNFFLALSIVTTKCKMHFGILLFVLFLLDHDRLECVVQWIK